ncbi:hypothetical protein GJ496_008811 [Pomphorhynchus laevis]|nr:hypothetical protein GJ496_008811 [Pomphorhynchus laevis]
MDYNDEPNEQWKLYLYAILCDVENSTINDWIDGMLYTKTLLASNQHTDINFIEQIYCSVCEQSNFDNFESALCHIVTNHVFPRRCHICSHLCFDGRQAINHLIEHHRNMVNHLSINSKSHKRVESNLRRSERSRRKSRQYDPTLHICPFTDCSRTFRRASRLRDHLNTHYGKSEYQCKLCNKSFTRKDTLDVHIKTVHEGIKPFICQICNYRASQSSLLRSHIKNVHRTNTVDVENTSIAVDSSNYISTLKCHNSFNESVAVNRESWIY